MPFVNVTDEEWEDARVFFKKNKAEIKYRKADTLIGQDNKRGKAHTHSFIKILNDIYALNNLHHINAEADAGAGSFGRVKFAVNQKGHLVVVKIMGIQWHEAFKKSEIILQEIGQLLDQVKRKVKKGESGKIKSLLDSEYRTKEKVLTILTYLGDRDLFSETRKDQELTLAENLVLGFKVMFSVWHLHQKRILHRDIKEENFVLSGKGTSIVASLVDFDFAEKLPPNEEVIFFEGNAKGTEGYIAPETLKWRRCSFASDVYALGVMFKTMKMPEALWRTMVVADWDQRVSLFEAMEAMNFYIEKHINHFTDNDKEMLQAIIKEYNTFKIKNIDHTALAFSVKHQYEEVLDEVKALDRKALLAYVKNIVIVVDNLKTIKPIEIFEEKNKKYFYVVIIQLLLKKHGFPSDGGLNYIARQMADITKLYSSFQKSGLAKQQAQNEAKQQSFINEQSKTAFIEKREQALLDLKLHEYSVEMKAWLISAFEFSLNPILEVFKPIQESLPNDTEAQYEFMMTLFSTFGLSIFSMDPSLKEKDTHNLFLHIFSTNPDQNAAADENKKLLEKLKGPILLYLSGAAVPKKALLFSKRTKISKSPKRSISPSPPKSSSSTQHSIWSHTKNTAIEKLEVLFRKLKVTNMRRGSLIVGQFDDFSKSPRLR